MKLFTILSVAVLLLTAGLLRAGDAVRSFSDYQLAAGDTVKTDVIVIKGNARIEGVILGTLTVYKGDIHLGPQAVVQGEVKTYAGRVFRNGSVDEASSNYLVRRIKDYLVADKKFNSLFGTFTIDSNDSSAVDSSAADMVNDDRFFGRTDQLDRSFFSYNRAEGLYLGLGTDFKLLDEEELKIGISAYGGYAFREKKWKYSLQEQLSLYSDLVVLGAVQYDNTLSNDSWKLDQSLNSLAALTIHEDYFNYYGSRGYGFFAGSNLLFNENGSLPVRLALKTGYYDDRIRAMRNATDYALFSSKKHFAPALELSRTGTLKTLETSAALFLGQSEGSRLQLGGTYETTFNGAQQDFCYEKLTGIMDGEVTIAKYLLLGEKLRLESSSAYSAKEGRAVADFKRSSLGGTGTLPGYALNSITGNRALLSRTSIGFTTDWLEDLRFLYDLGNAWNSTSNDLLSGFTGITLPEFKQSAGIGLVLGSSGLFAVHKRLDTGKNPYQMQLTVKLDVNEIMKVSKDAEEEDDDSPSKLKPRIKIAFEEDDAETEETSEPAETAEPAAPAEEVQPDKNGDEQQIP